MKGISVLRVSKNVLEFASLMAMAAVFVLFARIFQNYPADTTYSIMFFGRGFTIEKITLFVLFAICGGTNAILFVISRFPSLYRYPFKITADNIEIQYHLAKIMLSILQISVSALFAVLFVNMYYNGVKNTASLPWGSITCFFILLAGTVITYLALARKYK